MHCLRGKIGNNVLIADLFITLNLSLLFITKVTQLVQSHLCGVSTFNFNGTYYIIVIVHILIFQNAQIDLSCFCS